MAILLSCGALWRYFKPGGLDVALLRNAITNLVFYLFLPALVMQVMWQAPIGWDTLKIALTAACGVLFGFTAGWLLSRVVRMPKKVAGAAIIASGIGNTVYLGLPVLEASFGPWARRIAIQYDLLACLPLLLSLGMLIARHHSEIKLPRQSTLGELKRIPALWAMLFAVVLNIAGVPSTAFIDGLLQLLSACVVPLMLISLGMNLRWQNGMRGKRAWLSLVAIIQLVLVPVVAWVFAWSIGLQGELLMATVVEAAMPCAVLGIMVCERYKLDVSFYAAAATLSTLISLASLPLWLQIVSELHG